MKLIGIDCAAQPRNVGLAVGILDRESVRVTDLGSGWAADRIASELGGSEVALLAVDAPLGWPLSLATELADHQAGQPIRTEPNRTFRRDTDRFVRQLTGKQPLDVGADRIARVAWSALALLADLRQQAHKRIGLAWQTELTETACIEVYPAATIIMHGLAWRGYKGNEPDNRQRRQEILVALSKEIIVPDILIEQVLENDDVFDAMICLLAAADFLSGYCAEPADSQMARREGWIWVRKA